MKIILMLSFHALSFHTNSWNKYSYFFKQYKITPIIKPAAINPGISLQLEMLPTGKIMIPGCEPSSALSSRKMMSWMALGGCENVIVDAKKALEKIPGSYIKYGQNSGGYGHRRRWFVLPPIDISCPCVNNPDYYSILREIADDEQPAEESYETCNINGMGFCPSPEFGEPPPEDPYREEGIYPQPNAGTLPPVPQWSIPPKIDKQYDKTPPTIRSDITIGLQLEVLPTNKVVIPGCEPVTAVASHRLAAWLAHTGSKNVYVELKDALKAIPGSYVKLGSNFNKGAIRQKWLILPPSDTDCPCSDRPDYYSILRNIASDEYDEVEYDECAVLDMGYCPSGDFEDKPPDSPYRDEGDLPFGGGGILPPLPPWSKK